MPAKVPSTEGRFVANPGLPLVSPHTSSRSGTRDIATRPAPAEIRRFPLPAALAGCAVLLAVTMTFGVGIGPVSLSPAAVWHVIVSHLSGHPSDSVADEIVWQIRLPRVLLAAFVGAALTTAGTTVQVLVRNALADPFLLGVSSGASVGATAVLLLGAFASLGVWAISVGSVLGALMALAPRVLYQTQTADALSWGLTPLEDQQLAGITARRSFRNPVQWRASGRS